jgi:hypothetical protein
MLVGASFSTVFILKHYTLNGVIKTGAEKMWGFVEQIADCDFGLTGKTIHEQHEMDSHLVSCEFVDQFHATRLRRLMCGSALRFRSGSKRNWGSAPIKSGHSPKN